MSCGCGAGVPSVAKKREGLYSAPFFKAAADHAAGSDLVDRLAEVADMRMIKSGAALPPDVTFGTFIVVVEGELKHTEAKAGPKRSSSTPVAVKPHGSAAQLEEDDDAMATRRAGDFFRYQGLGHQSSKAMKMAGGDISRIVAVSRSQIICLTPEALGRAISGAKEGGSDAGPFVAILEEMQSQDLAKLIQRVPCFEPLDKRLRVALAQLFSYEVVAPGNKLFTQGEAGDNFCILCAAPAGSRRSRPTPFTLAIHSRISSHAAPRNSRCHAPPRVLFSQLARGARHLSGRHAGRDTGSACLPRRDRPPV